MDGQMYFDDNKMDALIAAVTSAKETLVNCEDNIYKEIDNMSDGWSGDGYESYKTNANNYRPALNSVGLFFEAYVAMIREVKDEFAIELPKVDTALNMES